MFPWHEPLATTTRALPHLVAWTLIQYGLPSGFCSRRHVQASSLTQPSPHCSSLHHDDCLPLGLLPTTRAARRRPISDSRPRRAGLHHPYPVLLPRFGLHGLCRSGRRAKALVRARKPHTQRAHATRHLKHTAFVPALDGTQSRHVGTLITMPPSCVSPMPPNVLRKHPLVGIRSVILVRALREPNCQSTFRGAPCSISRPLCGLPPPRSRAANSTAPSASRQLCSEL